MTTLDITVTDFILDKHPPEPSYCTHFGCGKILTLPESLAGGKCLKHQNNENGKITTIAERLQRCNDMG